MIIWHKDEPVEVAALQLVNAIFGVPQISVLLNKVSSHYLKMIKHFTQYWKGNSSVLMDGQFEAFAPLSNYTHLKSSNKQKAIYAIYEDVNVNIEATEKEIDVLNGKASTPIVLMVNNNAGQWQTKIYNCLGEVMAEQKVNLNKGIHYFDAPISGLIEMKKI